jgi:hypothetical protein
LPSRNRVAGKSGVSVPNVRVRIYVVDRRRDVELPAHGIFLSFYPRTLVIPNRRQAGEEPAFSLPRTRTYASTASPITVFSGT